MEQEEYMWWRTPVGKIGAAVMAIGAMTSVGTIVGGEMINQAQDAKIEYADKVEDLVPQGGMYVSACIGGAVTFMAGQGIAAYGARRDKRRLEG